MYDTIIPIQPSITKILYDTDPNQTSIVLYMIVSIKVIWYFAFHISHSATGLSMIQYSIQYSIVLQ